MTSGPSLHPYRFVILSEAKDLCSWQGVHRSFASLRMTMLNG
jgi:hypothetical protein